MKRFLILFFIGIMAAAVLSGCNAEESGVPTDSKATEASAETAADVPESVEEAFAETANASDDIFFIGENKIENFGDYADKNYAVEVDTAFENIIKSEIVPNDFIPLTEPVGTSGLEVTVEELLPIAQTARNDMYLMEYGGKIFNYKDGHYLGYSGDDFYAFLNSLYDIFAEETNIAEAYILSLKCYDGGDNELLLSTEEMVHFKKIDEDIFNLKGNYDKITIDGGAGSNPTYLYNKFEITDRTETTLTLKNTAYYNEENDEPIQVFEYNMVLEDGTWKFLNFECWY